jgi:hypothetical protein
VSTNRSLSDEEFVRVVVAEVGDRSPSSFNQILYLLDRSLTAPSRFRFTFQPFLGMRDARVDALVQTAKLGVMLGRNGMPQAPSDELRRQVRQLLEQLPQHEDDLRLLAVADFVRRQNWHERAQLTLSEMLDRARDQFAPEATLDSVSAITIVDDLQGDRSRNSRTINSA